MRNIWHDIDPHAITPTHFTAVIEIPAGSKKKYELDKKTGLLRLDRILYTSTHYPANYGFIPRTYADDGDPLDVLVFCSETLDPMVEVDCYPIGTMRMIDGDAIDDKIIAELKAIVGEKNVTTSSMDKILYCHDMAPLPKEAGLAFNNVPDVIVRPETTKQIAGVVALAYKHGIPVTPRGSAS